MAFLDKLHHPERYVAAFLKWCLLGFLMGAMGGLVGSGFHYALHFVTHVRAEHPWLIFLLPVGGLLTVGIYQLFKMRTNRGTNEIIDAVLKGESVNPLIAPVIFLATAITHLFGGSAGREGAALQIGGSVASKIAKLLKLHDQDRKILIMSGMSAVFAGLFGTPLTAYLFVVEFISVGSIFTPALLPCYLAAYIASRGSEVLGVLPETHLLAAASEITAHNIWLYLLLALAVAALGVIMCKLFHKAEHLAAHHLPNPWVRIAVGGVVICGMTLLAGDQRFNGAGMDMALEAVAGHADWYSFLVKMLFTAVTLAAGFKGGEIVPTFCVGATFGCVFGGLLGLDPGLCGALGLIGLFCSVTNAPLASILLSIEMFGCENIHLFALVCVTCFVLSGNSGLYASQIVQFDKASSGAAPAKREKAH